MSETNGAADRRVYIETVGCQMNVLDSELVIGALRRQGYALTSNSRDADVILYNTCSVREHAEEKIYSALGRLKRAKNERPHLVIGVLGCMAQKDQQRVFERAPHTDFICSPGQLAKVPELIEQSQASNGRRQHLSALGLARTAGRKLDILNTFESYDPLREPLDRPNDFQAFVRVMMGCDKFCTYCIVPSVRGPEQGRHPEEIVAEVRQLAAEGVKEVTLIGQTVNSYKYVDGSGPAAKTTRLADVLARIHDTAGLLRIKFVTNYPNDMTDDLLDAVATLPKVSTYLHVPAQSGCNDVLKNMKRGYSVELYCEMLARIRERLPDATISSDFIVGFPSESEASFEKTCDLVRAARFKNSFVFKYSPRPGTKGFVMFIDDIPEEEKRRRNNHLLDIQGEISLEDNEALIGQTFEVLVEGPSKAAKADEGPVKQMTGRTRNDRILVFTGNERQAGQILPVEAIGATPTTLLAQVVTQQLVSIG